jgi:hypothetical protein
VIATAAKSVCAASRRLGTKGAAARRAVNADDTRWTGGRWYAIIGFTVQIPCTTISFKGPMWGNFVSAPRQVPFAGDRQLLHPAPAQYPANLIPVFNGYDAGNVLVQVADDGTCPSQSDIPSQGAGQPGVMSDEPRSSKPVAVATHTGVHRTRNSDSSVDGE